MDKRAKSPPKPTAAKIQGFFYTSLYHFLDFNFGGGFLGMRKSALMGCMSHRAAKETTNYGRMHVPPVTSLPTSKHLHFQITASAPEPHQEPTKLTLQPRNQVSEYTEISS